MYTANLSLALILVAIFSASSMGTRLSAPTKAYKQLYKIKNNGICYILTKSSVFKDLLLCNSAIQMMIQ